MGVLEKEEGTLDSGDTFPLGNAVELLDLYTSLCLGVKAREVFGKLPTHSSYLIEVCHYLHVHTKYSFVFITALCRFLADIVLLP